MEKDEIIEKYDSLVVKGKLPLVFRNIKVVDLQSNHELRTKKRFNSSMFNNRALKVKYVERAVIS